MRTRCQTTCATHPAHPAPGYSRFGQHRPPGGTGAPSPAPAQGGFAGRQPRRDVRQNHRAASHDRFAPLQDRSAPLQAAVPTCKLPLSCRTVVLHQRKIILSQRKAIVRRRSVSLHLSRRGCSGAKPLGRPSRGACSVAKPPCTHRSQPRTPDPPCPTGTRSTGTQAPFGSRQSRRLRSPHQPINEREAP